MTPANWIAIAAIAIPILGLLFRITWQAAKIDARIAASDTRHACLCEDVERHEEQITELRIHVGALESHMHGEAE